MKKAIRPGFGTDGLLLWREVKLLRCGDGELCIAGEKDVICLVKINGLLKALMLNEAFAFFIMAMIPILILYLCMQKYIVSGITAGAVKG